MIILSCYHPSFILRQRHKLTNSISYKFIGKPYGNTSEKLKDNYSGKKFSSFDTSLFDEKYSTPYYENAYIQIPCGRCIGCRIDYSRSWADRMTYHMFTCPKDLNWFITLTYSDDGLEKLPCNNDFGLCSLDYSHQKEFMIRLRNRYRDYSIDFYLSGEYGGCTNRPHFHAILFNVPFDDLVFWKLNDNGDPIYLSEQLQSLWDYGFACIEPFSWHGAAYTAKYVEKKSFGYNAAEYDAFGLKPEKSFCSRRPGIANQYYKENYSDIWKNNGLDVDRSINSSGHLGIPRYFRKLATSGDALGYKEFLEAEQVNIDRQNSDRPFKIENSSFDYDKIEKMLKFEEDNILNSHNSRKL